jgi:hypothetical protein
MFSLSYDAVRHVLVGFAAPGARADADYQRILAAVDKLDRDGKLANVPIAFVLVVDADSERPPPKWRRRLAEQRKDLTSPRVLMAIVSPSALTRGVMTAMNWISPPPAHVQMVNHATIEEAATWVEHLQGTPRATVQRMFEDVRTRASAARSA